MIFSLWKIQTDSQVIIIKAVILLSANATSLWREHFIGLISLKSLILRFYSYLCTPLSVSWR